MFLSYSNDDPPLQTLASLVAFWEIQVWYRQIYSYREFQHRTQFPPDVRTPTDVGESNQNLMLACIHRNRPSLKHSHLQI
ncbi:hypothetical protein GDO78_022266 [Eleutherodactylus coqui]|uniref:Uncharacterized protein n=1 Tax=Eleutherodactylus coqui TaxID=57060 RepID=A0A8J6E7X2_ELECQ|nr:hypothetical protein GDO78_022266 [Eleutherodactylus coqui]